MGPSKKIFGVMGVQQSTEGGEKSKAGHRGMKPKRGHLGTARWLKSTQETPRAPEEVERVWALSHQHWNCDLESERGQMRCDSLVFMFPVFGGVSLCQRCIGVLFEN